MANLVLERCERSNHFRTWILALRISTVFSLRGGLRHRRLVPPCGLKSCLVIWGNCGPTAILPPELVFILAFKLVQLSWGAGAKTWVLRRPAAHAPGPGSWSGASVSNPFSGPGSCRSGSPWIFSLQVISLDKCPGGCSVYSGDLDPGAQFCEWPFSRCF